MVQKDRLNFKPVILIGGTTAVGKSEIALKLAKKFGGEIISADSMQIYKGFDVGTAKLSKKEMQNIPHHLIDIKNGDETYSVAQFKSDAEEIILNILKNNKLPIVVGGTGLYLNALLFNYQFGGKGSYIKADAQFNFLPIVIEDEREKVYHKINNRVDLMISNGLIEEIEKLINSGFDFNTPAFRAIGYKEFKPYFENKATLAECVEELKKNTRHYAKRQVTWFKQWKDIAFFTKPVYSDIEKRIKEFLYDKNQ